MEMDPWDIIYDMVIDISSMNSLLKDGWVIETTTRGKQNYEEKKDMPSVLISVFGEQNTGKSFILSRISGIDLPTGYSIETKGLSIKYPIIEKQNFIFLDSFGFNQSLVKYKYDCINFQKDILSEKEYIEEMNTITSDRLLTEYFILNFILYYSNIPILVFEKLSFSQQELCEKAKKLLYGNQLLVIHNLKHNETKDDVYYYFKDY